MSLFASACSALDRRLEDLGWVVQVLHVREEAGAELSKHVQEVQHLHEESKADKVLS